MFRLTSSFFMLLVFGSAATANARLLSSHSCDLECPLNAPCRFGEADFSERTGLVAAGEATHQNGMHCDCPIGKFLLIVSRFVIRCVFVEISLAFPKSCGILIFRLIEGSSVPSFFGKKV